MKENMKVLTLIIKQKWFNEIISGEKTEEYRDVTPTMVKRYLELDEEGFEKEDENGNSIPIRYDAIRFFVGYNKNRDEALVEVLDAYTEIFVDEDGQAITFPDRNDRGEDIVWVAQQVVYRLGKILEVKRK